MVGRFGEGFVGIVGYEEAPNRAAKSNVIGGPIVLPQLGNILVVNLTGGACAVKPSP